MTGCGEDPIPEDSEETGVLEDLKQLYEQATGSTQVNPDDLIQWARDDIERMGDWEYRVVSLSASQDDDIEFQLNQLGEERWEIVWIERTGNRLRLFLKRPVKSYLDSLPLSELRRLLPGGGS